MNRVSEDLVWTQGPNGWVSRAVTEKDRERRRLLRTWKRGEVRFTKLAKEILSRGLSEPECAP